MIIINNKPLVIANRLNNKHLYKTNISEEKDEYNQFVTAILARLAA